MRAGISIIWIRKPLTAEFLVPLDVIPDMAVPVPARIQLEFDEREVFAANEAFYDAMESLDLAQMEKVWWHEDWVKCLHPGWDLITGWEDIRESWAGIFRSTAQLRVQAARVLVQVQGDVGWVSCIEDVTSTYESGFETALVESTNIFVRRQGVWRMAHHHTTPLPGRVPVGTSQSVQ